MAFSVSNTPITRRESLTLAWGGFCAYAGLSLFGCAPETNSAPSGEAASPSQKVTLDKEKYDALIAKVSALDAAKIQANSWAQHIKDAGVFRVGGVKTSILFSMFDETDGRLRGFDAGLSQMLARSILGDESKIDLVQVTSNTRESVLQNSQVDAVFATYSITDARKKVISFAGPYYSTQQGILVVQDNNTVQDLASLDGKNVAAQSGSTGPSILAELAPGAKVQEFATDEEARGALTQGRVDAYVIDETMLRGAIVRNPGKFKLVGESFGPKDVYGIGLALGSDGIQFINAFLKDIEDKGIWQELWQICIGDRTDATKAPEPPQLGL